MSVSTSDALAVRRAAVRQEPVTPAIRANDTTDIWLAGGKAAYGSQPSLPFRTAILEEAAGTLGDAPMPWVNLGLYSFTFNNDATLDLRDASSVSRFP